jgi:anti-sigma factor RsiW
MNKPPSWASREECLLLLNAYLDGELDAASVLEVERRLEADAALKAEHVRLVELRKALTSRVPKDSASDALRRRIAAITDPSDAPRANAMTTPRGTEHHFDWRQLAAAAALAAMVAGSSTYLALRQSAPASEIAQIVAGHQRALLAATPYDVASSDRHTVKPWFDGKLALSPQVVDLSDAGFQLVGGRVDVVDGRPVPTIVYRRRQHLISLTALPRSGSEDTGPPPVHAALDGYSLLRWSGHDFNYSAVSDLAENELEEFAARWRSGAAAK